MNKPSESKICQSCGRPFEWRKKWEKDWQQVKYCSKACNQAKAPTKFKEQILELLNKRDLDKTICPSEILDDDDKKDAKKMERVRSAGRLLAHEGKIEITQKGKAVDPNDFKGPIRFKLKKR
ncbi:MAG: hypothetical protein COW01_15515 [Bdellovibrionales bacterium CG12_big_fil_rev_8_21_14_0_65_38_15]|nr:MAG: hypothetical protein COW79_14680 [Bdellovibrionales bacterium CG22_combo_CG10-13_8_21_14_all_38_13]PIQ52379.1 MAG: hypothetical protein COW01_15515 [Bdellovibrionales bacterium CG12_big_fil_rev_8_21_14_0_65_38_15]PIR30464.1 MAG: hypothetical protein COV38_06845 [Bdellovibrionales bacterium CG11_big_fil_rev_8_21_14_0_20_38_13]